MRKTLIPFLIAGALSFASCTETFEPTVDYGDQTYINDYSALVAAVNNLNKSLDERFAALNKLLDKNMAELKVAIDGNTGAIKILGDNLESSLASINTTLFNGFTALTTQIDENGKKIVYAMNANGELLRLQMDATGKLISAQIETSAAKLAETINSQNADMAERFDALTLAMQAGLADISLKINNVDKTLDVQLGNVNVNLGKLNTTMFDGFKALNTTITENGNTIVTAMNKNGELLRLEISKTGELISSKIEASAAQLADIINSLSATLGEKFDALTLVTQAGLADISVKIDNVDKTLKIQLGSVNTNLGTLNTTMLNGFTALNTTITNNGGQIIEALNSNGELLRLQIDATGKLISAQIVESNKTLIDAINSQTTSLEAKFDALNGLITSGFASVTTKLDEVGAELHTDIQGVNTNLTAGFTTLGTKVDENGTKIVEAINAEGDKLEIALDKNGNIITTAIEDFNKEYTNTETANLAKLGEILGAVNTLNTSIGTMDTNEAARNKEIVDRLDKILAKDNIYTSTKPGETGEVIYMSPEKFQQIQEAGPGSNIYKLYADQIAERKVTILCKQIVNEDKFKVDETTTSNGVHTHAAFNPQTNLDTDAILVADPPKVEDFSNGIAVVKVIKTPVTRNYKVIIDTQACNSDYIYKITRIDADGRNDTNYSPTYISQQDFVLTVYNGKNIVDTVIAYVYCTTSDSSIVYQ